MWLDHGRKIWTRGYNMICSPGIKNPWVRIINIVLDIFWDGEKIEITVATWGVEGGGSKLDFELIRERSWLCCSYIKGNWGVASYGDWSTIEYNTWLATATLYLVGKVGGYPWSS